MIQPDYEYRGLLAKTWDFFRGDTSNWPDRFFFRDIIRKDGQPALDVGCGTGRLLLDYIADGLDVDGVDISQEMLEICREKAQKLGLRPMLYEQAMEALDLPRKYQTIIVPSSSFQLVTDIRQATEALKRFFKHLVPGGVLVMPFMILWQEQQPQQTEWQLTAEKIRSADGVIVRRWSRATYDIENQLEDTEDRYEEILDEEVMTSEYHRRIPATRWYTQQQAIELYKAAGFVNIQVLREFSFQPASAEDTLFSLIGTRGVSQN